MTENDLKIENLRVKILKAFTKEVQELASKNASSDECINFIIKTVLYLVADTSSYISNAAGQKDDKKVHEINKVVLTTFIDELTRIRNESLH